MRSSHWLLVAGLLAAALAFGAQPAAAGQKLRIPTAAEKAAAFAERTCAHDASCVRHGVSGCRRQRRRVALCRIFIRRNTRVQGKYRCSRLVRLSLIPGTRHARVSGLGSWRC